MPLYEYECEACAHRFERIQKFSDPPIETCPKCGSKVRKLFSSPAIQFKGSGFYITDYPKSGSTSDGGRGGSKSDQKSGDEKSSDGKSSDKSSDGKSSDRKSSDGKSSDSGAAAKTESKPEAKGETKS
jgi:putative FmdB family regulatory protein